MATNASTWFYTDPEREPFLIEERINHTFWNNRITGLYLSCTSTDPLRVEGDWRDMAIAMEWEPKQYLKLSAQPGEDTDLLIVGIKEILGFLPAVSYVDTSGQMIVEWHAENAGERIQAIQGDPNYRNIKRYTK